MPAPWENDAIVGQQPAQQAAPQFPGVVQGRPKPPPAPDPIQDRRDEIGLNRDEIGLQKDRIALEKLQAETAAGELSSKLGKEAGFYLRARSAGEAFDNLNVGPESQRRAAAGSVLPENWINQFTPEERQKAETFMEDFIAASLRYESGAAIGQDEFDRQARIYFPQPGDSQGTLEAKQRLRQNMIESLGMGAGPEAVTEVDRYLAGLATQGTMSEDDTLPEVGADEEGLQGAVSYEGETYEQKSARILAEADRMQAEQAFGKVGGTIDDAATLGKQGISLGLSDEAAGLGGALSGIFNGEGIVGGYTSARDQERARIDIARENLGGVGTALEVAGGGAGILAKPGQVMAAGRSVAASGQPISRPAVQNVLARQAGADGARIGAVGGFGYGEGLEGSAINTVGGAFIGGPLGYGGQRLGNALANRATPRRDASDLARAGQAEGVTVNRAMADPNSGNAVSRADASILGGSRIQREMEAVEGQLEESVERLGRGGQAMDRTATGDRVQRAGERVISDTREVTNRKYQAAERMAGDTKIEPVRATAAVDDMLAKLNETPEINSAEIKFLESLKSDFTGRSPLRRVGEGEDGATNFVYQYNGKEVPLEIRPHTGDQFAEVSINVDNLDDPTALGAKGVKELLSHIKGRYPNLRVVHGVRLTGANPNRNAGLNIDSVKPADPGGLSIGALRDMRTTLRKKISKGDLVFGQNEARVLQIMDEAAQDISAGLSQAGKANAASAFDAADTAYAARMDLIENTVQKLIGKRGQNMSAEQIAAKFESMAKSDAEGLRKFWSQLDPSERADMQATFANALGRNNKGEFSPAIFLNNVGGANRKMSERAIRVVFGKDGAESVKNLQRLATETNRVTSAMNSRTSKSGVATSMREWLVTLLLGSGPGALSGNVVATAATAGTGLAIKGGAEILSARALMSPKIQKWILQTPNTASPRAIDAHFNRLGEIAKAEPALAGEIEILRKGILGAANDNTGKLAAENQNAEEGQ